MAMATMAKEPDTNIDTGLSGQPQASNYDNLVLFIDLDTVESYMQFLNQIKDLGMTKAGYQYILLTLVF